MSNRKNWSRNRPATFWVRLRFQSASRNIIQAKTRQNSCVAPMRVCTPPSMAAEIAWPARRTVPRRLAQRPNRKDSGFGFVPCRHDDDGFAAAAGFGLIRICKDEARRQLVALEIHFRPDEKHHRLRIDEDTHALVFYDLVEGALGLRVIHGVAHAGAAAVLYPHPNADIAAVGLFHDVVNARGRGFSEPYHFGSFAPC